MARRSDGSIVAWSCSSGGCNVPPLPPGVRYVDLASGGLFGVARRSDGTAVVWGGFAPSPLPDAGGMGFVGIVARTDSNLVVALLGSSRFTSLCDPGSDGVHACPCANAPAGGGRGCDNSAATGGAALSASGAAYLAADSLMFTTSGEKPTATSVLLQGTTPVASGAVYGQGVRCLGGALKRLFTKSASGGSITAPSFAAGDASVSARSAAKGDPIHAGDSRWYLVYYRDPTVLGGCPSSSTFNTTQTGRVDWHP